ncbi:MAG: PTS sugar transporter subunit IIB [Firmicutes bacterium]|nr:PTS sugar transporter subunit IIB [Erysipelotrichaceae bacterium]MDD6524934.1 PTS sugar transporter subunit IIB [Bacillota bacterium]MDY4973088.1 PTS sugar transporter subunit IIB [Erysipelotrichaceae bacterium]
MEILSARIDERLVHAQTTINWIEYLKCDRVIVIDDNILADDIQKNALKMSCPKNVKLSILESNNAASRFKENFFENERVLILFRGFKSLNRLISYGYMIDKVYIGNLRYNEDDKIEINKNVSISPEQKEVALNLIHEGVKLYLQLLPSHPCVELKDLL